MDMDMEEDDDEEEEEDYLQNPIDNSECIAV